MAGALTAAAGVSARTEKPREATDPQTADPRWQHVLDLPCLLAVDLPLPSFTVADYLKLRKGSVISTRWRVSHDIPVRVNGTLIAWAELEGAGNRLAVRLTEMA